MNDNKLLNPIMMFLLNIGLGDLIYRIFSRKYLQERRKYFLSQAIQEKYNENIEILFDKESKRIYSGLIEYRYNRKRKNFPGVTNDKIYFPKDIISLTEKEIFVDCGAYIGDTVDDFIKETNGKFSSIVAFEPDSSSFNSILKKYKSNDNIFLYNKGCYSKNKKIGFKLGSGEASKVDESQTDFIDVVKLDDINECKNATFIKMDIEGSELEALKGAKNIIIDNKPKLAICIYHSDNDMIDIINYIHNIVPEYKIFVRQHGMFELETVMYAIID